MASPYPTGTYNPQDAPSFAWRANAGLTRVFQSDEGAAKNVGLKLLLAVFIWVFK